MIPRPVTILTGFRGAGKSTLLKSWIADESFGDTAVIVNKVDTVGFDGQQLHRCNERPMNSATSSLCCSIPGDIRKGLLALAQAADRGEGPSFSRVVIETPGIADPAPFLLAFMADAELRRLFSLNGVVTCVDSVNAEATLAQFEAARRQLAVADLIVLTKLDIAITGDHVTLGAWLRHWAPNALLLRGEDTNPADIFSIAAFDPAGKPPDTAYWTAHHANRIG
ncbi:CobW family GTP-binding protein [Paracoccus onubensis]|uniref:CobW/HypB/UreG nucleotide-binding domain-containing protein n=1 Tax=Paracoccus onubensis TaxID=1675788 RepID=A0A418ST33_9RHOB|nr:GTP-binding protein [Paracoccus onubensis]RJE84082.1 hypothetical protein D3P04_13810 [Paracoccus onubensis]